MQYSLCIGSQEKNEIYFATFPFYAFFSQHNFLQKQPRWNKRRCPICMAVEFIKDSSSVKGTFSNRIRSFVCGSVPDFQQCEMLNQCWHNVALPSAILAPHYASSGSVYRVCQVNQ